MKTLRNTCVLLAVCLAVSFCTGRVGAEADAGAADKTAGEARPGQFFIRLQKLDNYYREIAVLVLMAVYVANIIYGRAVNERLAIAWTAEVRQSAGQQALASAQSNARGFVETLPIYVPY